MKQIIAGGEGFVGKEIAKIFPDSDIYDKKFDGVFDYILNDKYEVCHIAVPTPMSSDGSADISAVEDVLQKVKADLYIIHSTIPPGTTDMLEGKYHEYNWRTGVSDPTPSQVWGKNIVMQPEYVASDSIYPAPYPDMKSMPFIILGGRNENTKKARRLYEKVYPPTIRIYELEAKCAEVIKYAENSFIATKLAYCSELFRISMAFGVDYDRVREGVFRLDPRMTEWWTLSQGKGYKSKCLDKDIPAIIHASEKAGYNPEFLKSVVQSNERFKNE